MPISFEINDYRSQVSTSGHRLKKTVWAEQSSEKQEKDNGRAPNIQGPAESTRGSRAKVPMAMKKAVALAVVGAWAVTFPMPGWSAEKLKIKQIRDFDASTEKFGASGIQLRNTLWWRVARARRLDPYILYAVALVESANVKGHKWVAPWPWALNKSGKPILPASKEEAHAILQDALARGEHRIDVGLMQVNLRWNGHRVGKPEELLDPATNVRVGADLLAEAISSAPNDLVLGIGRYHSWQDVHSAITYGRRVLAVAGEIKALF